MSSTPTCRHPNRFDEWCRTDRAPSIVCALFRADSTKATEDGNMGCLMGVSVRIIRSMICTGKIEWCFSSIAERSRPSRGTKQQVSFSKSELHRWRPAVECGEGALAKPSRREQHHSPHA